MAKPANTILDASAPREVAAAVARIGGEEITEIDVALPRALSGDAAQVRAYVAAYVRLTEQVLDAVGAPARPRRGVPWARSALHGEAMSAPFSPWVAAYGPGRGAALALVAALRRLRSGTEPIATPARSSPPTWNVADADVVRFYRAVGEALEDAEAPLDRVRAVLGLNRTELAALFGVKRQALERWDLHGVPAERQTKLATLGAIADLLAAQLKPDRIAGMVRRPASAYGERSILAAVTAGAEENVLDELRDAFDWASAA